MNYGQSMKELEAMGTAQNRKIYARHGMQEPMFGVSYANLQTLRKDILRIDGRRYAKHDHGLAMKLWDSGNQDARALACMIADPAQMRSSDLDRWIRECGNRGIEGMVVSVASRSAHVRTRMEKWRKSRQDLTAAGG